MPLKRFTTTVALGSKTRVRDEDKEANKKLIDSFCPWSYLANHSTKTELLILF